MMMEPRKTICLYRLDCAVETLDEAQTMFNSNHLRGTVNRIYYAMFYAVNALAYAYEFNTSKHSSLVGWFNKNFIHSGRMTPESGGIFRKAYELRSKGDYTDFARLNLETVQELLQAAKPFIETIRCLTLERLEEKKNLSTGEE